MAVTNIEGRSTVCGKKRIYTGTFNTDASSGDIQTPMRRVIWAQIVGMDFTNNTIQINRNSNAVDTEDVAGKEGMIHFEAAGTGKGNFYVEGY